MAHKSVVAAVQARMAAHWSLCPVIGMNEQGTAPQDGSPYIQIQYPASRTDRVPVDTPLFREQGGIRFLLFLPSGEGTARADDWCEQLAHIFRDATFDGVRTDEPSSPFYDDSNDLGGWFLATTVVPYWFDYTDPGV